MMQTFDVSNQRQPLILISDNFFFLSHVQCPAATTQTANSLSAFMKMHRSTTTPHSDEFIKMND
jgi:hypothetical protein